MKTNVDYDVVIIGAGPAGISAAIYLKRAGIDPLVIEKESPGGTLNRTKKIENYPGFIDEEATTLAFRMYSQLEELGVELKVETVKNIEKENDSYNVITNNTIYKAKFLLLATGKVPKKLDIKGAKDFEGKGISYCAVCDGVLYKNKNIAVIGGGNSAMETVSYMSDIANKIYVINRSNILRATEKEKQVLEKNNVEVIYNAKVINIMGKENVKKIKLDNNKELDVSAIFVCIGQDSNTSYYQGLKLNDDKQGIIVNDDMKTSCNGVYAAGDVISKKLYQVVTATSEGAIAATSIIKKIKSKF